MKALTFTIHLLEPVLIARVMGGDPNSASGVSFIPGSAVRGMLIARYQRSKGHALDAADPEFRRLFLDGRVCFLNAYPLLEARKRMLPTPLSWQADKEEPEPRLAYDAAVAEPPEARLKPISTGGRRFCYLTARGGGDEQDVTVEFHAPARQINIHTYREDRRRQQKQRDTVFRYESIAEGERFGAVIMSENDDDLRYLQSLLEADPEFHIGKARTAGYGRVRVEEVHLVDGWEEYRSVGEYPLDGILVTCLSDVLLRGKNGVYVADFDALLGEKRRRAFVRVRVIGGFNRKWGLPLPQAQAVQAGSVYVYPRSDALLARLRHLEASGVGERRAEGFGRIAVNWHRVAELCVAQVRPQKPLPVTLDGAGAGLASRMVERMLRAELDSVLIGGINRLAGSLTGVPSNAQLSRLRRVLRRSLVTREGDSVGERKNRVAQHLDGLKKTARGQFESARIAGRPLSAWLRERVAEPQSVWGELGIAPQQMAKRLSIGGVRPPFDDALALEYTVRLIDGVLHRAMKEHEQ
jgi:CRISPR-associated protein Csx10